MDHRLAVVAAVGLLLATVTTASHLETVFSITMPSEQNFETSYILGDALYVICGNGSTVEAVNLTTRTNMWVSPNLLNAYGYAQYVAVTTQVVLLEFEGPILVALSAQTGQQLWAQDGGYSFMYPPAAYSNGNTVYVQVLLPNEAYALQAFDLATGTPGFFQYGALLVIYGDTAFVGHFSIGPAPPGGLAPKTYDPVLRAIDIPTNTTLWTKPWSLQRSGFGIPAVSEEYVVVSNMTGGDEIAVVLHRRNGTVVQSFQAFNGLSNSNIASLHGNLLFACIGLERLRFVVADLTTGYIQLVRHAESQWGAAFAGGALFTISHTLELTITPANGSSPIVIPHVPTTPAQTVINFGFGLLQVVNVAGYTMWDSAGNLVARNYQTPGLWQSPLTWNGLVILISGSVVTGVTLVK